MAASEIEDERVLLGHVAGAHGIAGALRVRLFNAESNTLRPELEVELRQAGQRRTLIVDRVAPKPGSEFVRVWLREVADRDAAAALQGAELWVDRGELPALADDEYYLADVIGHAVVRRVGDRLESLGTIVDVTSNGMQDLFEIRRGGETWLMPAMPPFVVEIAEGQVIVDVHDDMLPGA
ncbi:ribosome maturation factor RimM [Nannocystaceae bacterium ST9]